MRTSSGAQRAATGHASTAGAGWDTLGQWAIRMRGIAQEAQAAKREEGSNKLSAHVVLSENNESNERLCVREREGGGRAEREQAHHRKPNP